MKECEECGATIPYSYYAAARKREGLTTRDECRACGTSYCEGERIGRPVRPIDTRGALRYSAWKVYYTRPVVRGWYHCRFSCIEPTVLTLWWDGLQFTLADGRPIQMDTFMGWRGVEV